MSGWIVVIVKILLPYLIQIAIKFGLPELGKWILRKIPWISKETVEKIIQIVSDALSSIEIVKSDTELTKDAKKEQIRAIKRQANRDCVGVACLSDTKGL